jgi:uracil-DNA glycosylase family 4
MQALERIGRRVIRCRQCPRLVAWRTAVAAAKVKRFRDWTYWAKPVPGFGDASARLLIVGLAPAAHGANRTGRMFTGDRSGDWLFAALHRFGFANQPHSIARTDGLQLTDCYVSAVCRCAPPANKPLPAELQACRPYLLAEIKSLKNLRVIVALGKTAFDAVLQSARSLGIPPRTAPPRFSHGVSVALAHDLTLLGSYHPSQQNTFTGKLTRPMFHRIFRTTRRLLASFPSR